MRKNSPVLHVGYITENLPKSCFWISVSLKTVKLFESFWCFLGVQKWISGMKWVKDHMETITLTCKTNQVVSTSSTMQRKYENLIEQCRSKTGSRTSAASKTKGLFETLVNGWKLSMNLNFFALMNPLLKQRMRLFCFQIFQHPSFDNLK